ncbi:MAG: hypothetical protein LBR69_00305 [Endomicrobium sp.]|nr:hypothetical protein [Endomicrobium sp.]
MDLSGILASSPTAFNAPVWVQVSYNRNDFLERTPLTASPYALSVKDGVITSSKIADGAIVQSKLAPGLSVSSAAYAVTAATASFVTGAISTASYAMRAGTATYATTAVTASFVTGEISTASYAMRAGTATYAVNAATASFVTGAISTSSYAMQAGTATYAVTAATASFVTGEISTASYAMQAGTASYADVAGIANDVGESFVLSTASVRYDEVYPASTTYAINAATATWVLNFPELSSSVISGLLLGLGNSPVSVGSVYTSSGTVADLYTSSITIGGGVSLMFGTYDTTPYNYGSPQGGAYREEGLIISTNVRINGTVSSTRQFLNVNADLAEIYPSYELLSPGDVVVISDINDGYIEKSKTANDTKVAGVISTEPGMVLNSSEKGYKLALVGKVPVNVTNEGGDIKRGDLLVASSTPGYAMKAVDPKPGTIIGKALGSSSAPRGKISALVNLQ